MHSTIEYPYSTPRRQKGSHFKTEATNFTQQIEENQVYANKLFDYCSPIKQKSSIQNDSILSFNRPDIGRQDIQELFREMKVINFLVEDIASKNKLIDKKTIRIRQLKEERQLLESQIAFKNRKFDKTKITLLRKRKVLTEHRQDKKLFMNKQIYQLQNKIYKVKKSISNRCKTDYSMESYLNESSVNSSFHNKKAGHRRLNSQRSQNQYIYISKKQRKRIYIPMMMPYPQYQSSNPYHPPSPYSHMPYYHPFSFKPSGRRQNSTSFSYFNNYASDSSCQNSPQPNIQNAARQHQNQQYNDYPSQFSFNHLAEFNNKLSNAVSKKNSRQSNGDSEININITNKSRRDSFPSKSRKSSGHGSTSSNPNANKKSDKRVFVDSQYHVNIHKEEGKSQYKFTKSNLNEQKQSYHLSSVTRKIQQKQLVRIQEQANNSMVNMSIPSSLDKDSFEKKSLQEQSKKPSSSKKKSNREQSAVVLDSKYMEDIKSLSGHSQNQTNYPALRILSKSKMGYSAEPTSNISKHHSRKSQSKVQFENLLPFMKQPDCQSDYETTPRVQKVQNTKKQSSQDQAQYNFRTLEEISDRDRSKLMVHNAQDDDDDILSDIYLSTESRISREKNNSKLQLNRSVRDDKQISRKEEKLNRTLKSQRRRKRNSGSSQQKEQDIQIQETATKIRLSTPSSIVRLTRNNTPQKADYSSIEQANEQQQDINSSIRKKSSKKATPRQLKQ